MRKLVGALAALLFASPALAGGSSGGGTGGAAGVASLATACPTSGAATGAVTLTASIPVNSQTGTSYTIVTADCGKTLTFNNAGAVAVTLPQAGSAGFASGYFIPSIVNLGAGTVTITPTTSTINGAANLTLATNQSAGISSNGSNYFASLGKGAGGAGTQNNFTATSDPGVSNDGTQGYSVGSVWHRSDTGQVWRARDVTTGAAKWDQQSTVMQRGYVASRWYSLPFKAGASAASGADVAGSIYCTPFIVFARITISQIAVRITTLSSGNSNLALQGAIYATSASDPNRPGVLLASNSSAGFNTSGVASVSSALNSNIQVEPGQYFFCVQPFDTTVKWAAFTPSVSLHDTATLGAATAALAVNGSSVANVSTTGTFGTWPDLTGTTMAESAVALGAAGGFLVASVP